VQAAARPAAVDLSALLVQVAADRTGYSPDMLDADLNLEADLGIDSIKRVEILSAVRRQLGEADQQRLQAVMDTLTRVKTLREMARTIAGAVDAPASGEGASPAEAPVSDESGRKDLARQLLIVVSERTGYPVEMLGADLNIEADLGIDSIKRVEILTTFRQQRTAAEQTALQGVMDQLTRLKTLAELSRTIEQALATDPPPAAEPSVPRTVFALVDAPAALAVPAPQRSTGVIVVSDDGTGVAGEVCVRLRGSGNRPVLLRHRDGAAIDLSDGVCVADWTDAETATRALARVREAGPIAALLHLAPLADAPPLDRMSLGEWQRRIDADLRQLHILTRAAAPDLRAWGRGSGAAIVAATALGGDFGQSGRLDRPTHGGVLGYLRTAAIEFPDVRVRVVDFDASEPAARAAQRIVSELDVEGPVEIGYYGARRVTLAARQVPLTADGAPAALGAESVVLLTGGARGITSEIAAELARRHRPALLLAGLTALPREPEPSHTAALEGSALKAIITSELRKGQQTPRPVDVEAVYQRIVRQREIRATLAACQAAGSPVEYHQLDVRDEAALKQLVDGIYARFGRLDLVVHGAGVIEDKLIDHKTVESFDRVVHTKADSVFTLARVLRRDTLGALVLMSSVTAAFGNRGQADYGAANGVYNAMAQWLARRSSGRVVAMNWGPWDKVGMASEEVRRQFLARGITPIDPAPGVRAMLDELAAGPSPDAIVVIGAGPWTGAARTERRVETVA
jgi:NAD(P)-dependent dehydrogenase (short-subunit alcohol dehydrogenase family)/acyl carrier protein